MSEAATLHRAITLRYFARVREDIGTGEETLEIPADLATVADLARWLKGRGEGYERAFADENVVRAAVDRMHVKPSSSIAMAREIAFFPPMTGG